MTLIIRKRQRIRGVSTLIAAAVSIATVSLGTAQPLNAQRAERHSTDPRWAAIRRIFGQTGETEGEYFRVNLPRTDLHVRIGTDVLEPPFELTSYVGFIPRNAHDVVGMGEVVLLENEVPAAFAEMRRQDVHVMALHNHLLGESPHVMFIHVMAEGNAEATATRLRAVFATTATPLGPPSDRPVAADWSAIDAILGKHAEAGGATAEYVFPRRESLQVHGNRVESTGLLETASQVVFQRFADGHVACGGELFVLPAEVDLVVNALDEHGLHVTAVHNHTLDENPRMYWIHWYGTGDGPTLARGVATALDRMNGVKRSHGEQ